MLNEPLSQVNIAGLVQANILAGRVFFSHHAQSEMTKDALDTVDVLNVFAGDYVETGEFENRSWSYRIRTARIYVVVAF